MAVHVVNIQLVNIGKDGTVIPPGKQAPIREVIEYSSDHRIAPNPRVPNSANWPSMEEYLILEDAEGFIVRYIDQYKIVTQDL